MQKLSSKLYCIYSNKEIDREKCNVEHIIPLSLGGSNDFTILVDKHLNSTVGNKVDGNFHSDPLMKMKLIKSSFRGHSGKLPRLDLKKSKTIDGKPIIVSFTEKGLELFDPIKRKEIINIGSLQLKTEFMINPHIRIKFICKVALAAGFFVYGNTFLEHADHDSLRRIVFSKDLKEEIGKVNGLRFYDNLRKVEDKDKGQAGLIKMQINYLKGSSVLFTLSKTRVIVHLGIAGEYVGSVNLKANSDMFPNEGEFKFGRVLVCKEGRLYQDSYWHSVDRMLRNLEK